MFGYGSLIYKVDFPYLDRRLASIEGWSRRFWQGSHDHRGTPDAPGRVVTLAETPNERCYGVAYRIEDPVFEHLDHREKNGYQRVDTLIALHDGEQVTGTTYIGAVDNIAFLGPAPVYEMAAHINQSHGPSGSNRDYLLDLAEALRSMRVVDEHVSDLEKALLSL